MGHSRSPTRGGDGAASCHHAATDVKQVARGRLAGGEAREPSDAPNVWPDAGCVRCW